MAFLRMWCPVYVVYARLSSLLSSCSHIVDPHVEVLIIAGEVTLFDAWTAMLQFITPHLLVHPTDVDPKRKVEFFLVPITYADDRQ